MEKNGTTRRASSSKDALSTREKRDRKRYLCAYVQKHRELTPADKAVGRLLVNWYNEKAGNCYASIEALANELELSRRTTIRAVGKLHRLGIVRRDIGGGWDHGKLRWNTSKYYPAFELVTHKDTGRPRKNLPPSLSTLPPKATADKGRGCHSDTVSKCHPMSPPESQAERGEGVSNCHPNSDSDSGGANASPISPNGSTGSLAPELEGLENLTFHFQVEGLAKYFEISPEDLLALIVGIDETSLPEFLASCERHFRMVWGVEGGEYIEALAFNYESLDLEPAGLLSVERAGGIVRTDLDRTLTAESVLEIDYSV